MPNNRKFRDCSALSVTAALFPWHALKLSWQQRISDHQSDSLLPAEIRSHTTRQKNLSFHITIEIFGFLLSKPKEILDWNVCQVTVTESIVVFLQSRSSIYIFTDSLFFLLCLFSSVSFCVHWAISQFFSARFAHSNGRLQSRISLSAYSQ